MKSQMSQKEKKEPDTNLSLAPLPIWQMRVRLYEIQDTPH